MLAQALYSNFGGGGAMVPELAVLAGPDELMRAAQWGLAIRLAQRLSAGLAGPLERSSLGRDAEGIVLTLEASHAGLAGETVNRRLRHLAQAMGVGWRVALTNP